MMYGSGAYGEFAYGDFEIVEVDASAFELMLADDRADRVWLMEIEARSLGGNAAQLGAFGDAPFGALAFAGNAGEVTGGDVTLRYATREWVSRVFTNGIPGTDPADANRYDGRLTDSIRIDRRIVGREAIGGLTEVYAQARLINVDGALDSLTTDYALDGRRVTLWLGRPTDVRADFGQVFGGVIENAVITETGVELRLSDGRAKLRQPIQSTLYAGSGGLEGGADLVGKPKPLCYGRVFNITPPLVDAANLIYQVHAGAIDDVPAVYDRGVALVQVGGAPAPGEYQVDTALGTFKLGGTPAGTVTCDVEGSASPSYVETAADIVRRILSDQAGLDSVEINSASLSALNAEASQPIGLWIGTDVVMTESVVNELLLAVGAFGGFNRLGAFTVGLITEPAGVVDGRFDRLSIRSLERVPLPAELDPICWRVQVGYQKNYTVQNDLAASVSAARRTFAAQPLRYAKTEDSVVADRHRLARELLAGGLYALEADAQTEAVRLQSLWGRLRKLYRIRAGAPALQRDLGDLVELEHPRHGLASAALGRVVGHEIDARGANVTLTVVV